MANVITTNLRPLSDFEQTHIFPLSQLDPYGDLTYDPEPGDLKVVGRFTQLPTHVRFTIHKNVFRKVAEYFSQILKDLKRNPQSLNSLNESSIRMMLRGGAVLCRIVNPRQKNVKMLLYDMSNILHPKRLQGVELYKTLREHQHIWEVDSYCRLLDDLELEDCLEPSFHHLKFVLWAITRMTLQESQRYKSYIIFSLNFFTMDILAGKYSKDEITAFEGTIATHFSMIRAYLKDSFYNFKIYSTDEPKTYLRCNLLILLFELHHWKNRSVAPRIDVNERMLALHFPLPMVQTLVNHLNNRYTPFNPTDPHEGYLFASSLFKESIIKP